MSIEDLATSAPAITTQRIRALLAKQDWEHFVRDDGVPAALIQANRIGFRIPNDEQLLVSPVWHMTLDPSEEPKLAALLDAHNRAHPNLKAYTDLDANGRLLVFTESAADYTAGATGAQLHQQLYSALEEARHLFAHLSFSFGLADSAEPFGPAWYARPDGVAPSSEHPAASMDRIERACKEREWTYTRDGDVIEMNFIGQDFTVRFDPAGAQLTISSVCRHEVPLADRGVAEAAIRRYHSEKIWPTAAILEAEGATSLRVQGAYKADLSAGLNDAQLLLHLRVGLRAGQDLDRAIRWAKSKDDAVSPQPITQERLIAIIEENGWSYFKDTDGDLGAFFHNDLFYFFINNERLIVRGHWHMSLRNEEMGRLRQRLNDWNHKKLWPKCYYQIQPQTDRLLVQSEVAVDYEYGANDAQLLQQLRCAIGTSRELFDHLLSAFEV